MRDARTTQRSLGAYSNTIEYRTQDLTIAKEVDDRAGEGGAYGNAYISLWDFAKAINRSLLAGLQAADRSKGVKCSK
jgi:hypothetical protein